MNAQTQAVMVNFTADKILEGMGSERDLIAIASKQKKPMASFNDIYALARRQIVKELKADAELLQEEYEFYKEMGE